MSLTIFRVTLTLTSDLVLMIIVSGAYLLYYLRYESQFWCMNVSWDGGVSCTILWVTVTLNSDLVFRKVVYRAFLILLKVRIPNLVGGCNFWWRSITYHFWVTLTSDLVCRIIVSRTYLLYYLRWESQICCMDTSLDADVSHTIFRSLWSWPMT